MSRLETDTKPCPLCGREAEGYEWPHCVNEGVQINGGEVEDCPMAHVSMPRKAWQSLPRWPTNTELNMALVRTREGFALGSLNHCQAALDLLKEKMK